MEAELAQASERLQNAEEAFEQATPDADALEEEAKLEESARHLDELATTVETQQTCGGGGAGEAPKRTSRRSRRLESGAGGLADAPSCRAELERIAGEAEALGGLRPKQPKPPPSRAPNGFASARVALQETQLALDAAQSPRRPELQRAQR